MEKDGYITVVPAFDSVEPSRNYHGLYSLIGSDFSEMEADPVGLIPVQIEVPEYGWSMEIVESEWERFWTHVLGSPPRKWWNPHNTGAAKTLYNAFTEWVSCLRRDYKYPVPQMWEEAFEDQIYWTGLIPRRVVASACDACAKPGGWTLTSTMFLWHLSGGGQVRRWDPMIPSGAMKDIARNSHLKDYDEHLELCDELWKDYRSGMNENDPAAIYETLGEMFEDEDLDEFVSQINGEAALAKNRQVQAAHIPLWHPPDWVQHEIDDGLKEKADMGRRFSPNYSLMNVITPAIEVWEMALYAERECRRIYG